jgi:hypothetical protein
MHEHQRLFDFFRPEIDYAQGHVGLSPDGNPDPVEVVIELNGAAFQAPEFLFHGTVALLVSIVVLIIISIIGRRRYTVLLY